MHETDTAIIGGGQAGLAMSAHLRGAGVPHVVLERGRIAERWRSERWDSLVANGPAWHDRFPARAFDVAPDAFAPAAGVAAYFEGFAAQIDAPVRCGVEVRAARPNRAGGFDVETSEGPLAARSLVVATGPFQRPLIPPLVPEAAGIAQLHSAAYRAPGQLPGGGVLVVGAGSSGAQIAEELLRAGRRVHLSVGPHDRPPRRYRGRDFCWWLGELGHWDAAPEPGREHVTIAVSGARGGRTVDFRRLAAEGMVLHGRTRGYQDGVMTFDPDLADNLARGDRYYLALLDEADAHAAARGLGPARGAGGAGDRARPGLRARSDPVARPRRGGHRDDPLGDGLRAGLRMARRGRVRRRRPSGPRTGRDLRAGAPLPRPALARHAGLGLHLGRLARRRASRGPRLPPPRRRRPATRDRLRSPPMAHARLRPFNARDTYPGQDLDADLAQAVVTRGGRTVWMRGQCPQDLDSARSLDSADPAAQADLVMRNIRRLIEEAGGEMAHLVKVVVYLTDVRHREAVYRVMGAHLKGVHPVSTGLVVSALARPEWLVEIDATAVIPD